ncbi:hypothetical protein J7E70_17145 [Variovorax paradoxus]|nr:hypothetical protein [Variovorax paradoxus]MBT2302189.1 hypothetical protein [Variovorax paradoxus]
MKKSVAGSLAGVAMALAGTMMSTPARAQTSPSPGPNAPARPARDNGVTQEELIESITHLAF